MDKGFMEGMAVWYALIPNPRTSFCESSDSVNSCLEAFITSLGHQDAINAYYWVIYGMRKDVIKL